MFKSKVIAPAELEAQTQKAFESVSSARAVRKDSALSTFRATVQELHAINEDLDQAIATSDEAIAFYTQKREAAVKEKADNEAVANRIIEIIGE